MGSGAVAAWSAFNSTSLGGQVMGMAGSALVGSVALFHGIKECATSGHRLRGIAEMGLGTLSLAVAFRQAVSLQDELKSRVRPAPPSQSPETTVAPPNESKTLSRHEEILVSFQEEKRCPLASWSQQSQNICPRALGLQPEKPVTSSPWEGGVNSFENLPVCLREFPERRPLKRTEEKAKNSVFSFSSCGLFDQSTTSSFTLESGSDKGAGSETLSSPVEVRGEVEARLADGEVKPLDSPVTLNPDSVSEELGGLGSSLLRGGEVALKVGLFPLYAVNWLMDSTLFKLTATAGLGLYVLKSKNTWGLNYDRGELYLG